MNKALTSVLYAVTFQSEYPPNSLSDHTCIIFVLFFIFSMAVLVFKYNTLEKWSYVGQWSTQRMYNGRSGSKTCKPHMQTNSVANA